MRDPQPMLGGLARLILLRVLGARVMFALAAFGWLRRLLAGRNAARPTRSDRRRGYQPSQGESQTVQRDPR
jgi:hypothetical protein